jgi:hypothetical protein
VVSQDTVPPDTGPPDTGPPDTGPPGLRASDEDRENVIEMLRHGSIEGRISNDTFLERIDIALRAQRIEELASLLRDLPAPAQGRQGWLGRWAGWCSALSSRVYYSWRTPRLQTLVLPRGDRAFVIGRSPDCDLPLANMTVSWHHAELRCAGDEWLLADLGSTNGTRVNGWRAGRGVIVRPGDRVAFGNASFLVAG